MIPWYNLSWEETQKQGFVRDLIRHLADMTDFQIMEYGFYLTNFLEWPKGKLFEISGRNPTY